LLGLNFNKEISLMPQCLGLIEVLPLNFKCLSSSTGTTVDKTNIKNEKALYVLPEFNLNDPNLKPNIDTSIFNSIFNFNPMQYLNVERMEPISRHFVIIDFGFPVSLTDIMIPSCNELASISIDLWTHKEQKDSRRLCVSTDISQRAILLNDMQPPAVCRYLKLIFVAHSTNIVKAKIPLGHYFGFPLVFQNEKPVDLVEDVTNQIYSGENNKKLILGYLSYLEKLYEDKKCHYFMSLGKLRELLNDINFPGDNIGHLKMMQFNVDSSESSLKIKEAYGECLDNQFQFNLNAQLINKLRSSLGIRENNQWSMNKYDAIPAVNIDLEEQINEISQDKLRVCNGLLIKTLLSLTWRQHQIIPRPHAALGNF
jgi:baculoviral IAP repeat-containing protein 6